MNNIIRTIPLTKGYSTIVDEADYDDLMAIGKWCALIAARNVPYAFNIVGLMHKILVDAAPGFYVDHINHDTLDNRRANLRIVTTVQSAHNTRKHSDGSSSYKGVSWQKNRRKWVASICTNGTRYHIGSFADEIEAAKAYDEMATKLHGDYAVRNFND